MSARRIRTILYGDQRIEPTELDLLHTPALQRLYDLHQLGLADRVFIDASHSRLHHVIGVMEQVDNILGALIANLDREPPSRILEYRLPAGGMASFTPSQLANYIRIRRPSARLMGLLHDLTHVPYGHTLEDEIELHPQKHDHPERQADAFYRLILQYIGWLCIDDGQFERFSEVDLSGPASLFRQTLESPGLKAPPETDQFIDYVSGLAASFLMENKPSRAMQRAPGGSQLVKLFQDLRFALRALLWIDALHKDKLDDLLPSDPSRQVLIRSEGSYPFEKLIDASLNKAGQHLNTATDRFHLQRDAFLLDVIGNTICADLLDYAKRDSHFAGLRLDYDVDRIVENFTVVPHRKRRGPDNPRAQAYRELDPILRTAIGMFSHKLRIDVPGELMNLLQVRFYVYQRVLFHPTKCIAGAMLGSAIQLIGWKDLPIQFRYVGDSVFLDHVIECARLARDLLQPLNGRSDGESLSETLDGLFAKLDSIPALATSSAVRDLFETRKADQVTEVVADLDAAIRLLQRLGARRYHRGIFRLLPDSKVPQLSLDASEVARIFVDASRRAQAEREIERRCDLPRGSVTIHCPGGDGPRKIAEILILGSTREDPSGMVHPLREIGEIDREIFLKHQEAITAVEEMYKSMWRLIVSVSPPYTAQYSRVNRRIGRVLYGVLSGQPYEQIYGRAIEDELDEQLDLPTVPNDKRMEKELSIAREEDARDTDDDVQLFYPDGHRESRPLPFLRVADVAVHRLQDVNPVIKEFVEKGQSEAGASEASFIDARVRGAIPGPGVGAGWPTSAVLELLPEAPASGLKAARTSTLEEHVPDGGLEGESGQLVFTDKEVFNVKMRELSTGKTGAARYDALVEWAEKSGLLPLGRYPRVVKFLEFLYVTMKQHYGRTKVYSSGHLRKWFTEYNAGQSVGTKL